MWNKLSYILMYIFHWKISHSIYVTLCYSVRSNVVLEGDGHLNNLAARLATHGQGGDGGGGCTAGLAMSSVMVAHSSSESVLGTLSPINNNNTSSFHVNNNDPSPGDLALLAKLEEANRWENIPVTSTVQRTGHMLHFPGSSDPNGICWRKCLPQTGYCWLGILQTSSYWLGNF